MLFGGPPDGVVILHDEADRGIHGFGATQGEIDVLQRLRRNLHQLGGQPDGRFTTEVKVARGIGQLAHLLGGSTHHTLVAIANVDAPQAGKSIQQFFPIGILKPGTLA
ncbi:hypothetical protein GALL_495320 [mine drainage metagenome]|uniref:Uncharacterized protein n=1 Tax=mine drainage metagenome TaxID=410659 RepID=A0A1J5PC05_9ZZZZ